MNLKSRGEPRKAKKRDDIQGLRTVAILGVLLFHIWPDYFVRGFLGVDIFFVLSGYLMAMILSKHETVTFDVAKDFYFRRIKRIVPIYLVVVVLVIALGIYLICPADYGQLIHDTLPAVGFVSNMADILEEADYFDQVVKYRYFLHSWSLAVEMQFYTLVPFVFWFLLKFSRSTIYFPCAVFALGSLALQLNSEQQVAFGLLFCRIWQFMAGIMAFFVVEAMESEEKNGYVSLKAVIEEDAALEAAHKGADVDEHKLSQSNDVIWSSLSYVFLLTTLAFLSIQIPVPDIVNRVVVIVLTAGLLVVGVRHQNILLSNVVSVWIGDASYVLYLVHWPVIEFLKYSSIDKYFSLGDGVTIFAVSFCFTALMDAYVDSHFRAIATGKGLIQTIVVLYLVVFSTYGALMYQNHRKSYSPEDIRRLREIARDLNDPEKRAETLSHMNTQTAIDMNAGLRTTFDCPDTTLVFHKRLSMSKQHYSRGWECTWQGRGNKTALLVGNSHAKVMAEGFAMALADEYKTFHMFATNGCSPFKSIDGSGDCRKFQKVLRIAIRETRPDILALIFRYQTYGDRAIKGSSVTRDTITREYQELLDEASEFAEVIYIQDPQVESTVDVGMEMSKRLCRNLAIDNIRTTVQDYHRKNKNYLKRLDALDCPKCLRIRWEDVFCDRKTDVCLPYDVESKVSYFRDENHINVMGNYKLAPYLRSLRRKNATG